MDGIEGTWRGLWAHWRAVLWCCPLPRGETVLRLELCNQCFMLSYTTPPLPHPTTIYSHVSVEGSTALAAIEM